jgi:hypothetical protein
MEEYFEESVVLQVEGEGASTLYLILSQKHAASRCDKRAVTRYVTRFSLPRVRCAE